MRPTHMPAMVFRESPGWDELKHEAHTPHWFRTRIVLPLSVLPPLLYAFAVRAYPGQIFAKIVPPPRMIDLLLSGLMFYLAELAMVSYMAMLIQRSAIARDHDPGYARAYMLAAVAPIPLWLSSLCLLVPSRGLALAVIGLAWVAAAALIRHGTRPLLEIRDENTAHFIASSVTATGLAAWVGLLLMAAMILSLLLGVWS